MNNRDYKISASGGYFHVYNRGNAKQDVFLDQADYRFFLLRLTQNIHPNRGGLPRRVVPLPVGSFSLISYCLMPNHFHLLVRQNSEIPISALMMRICTSYSKFSNAKYRRVGHIFQDQFKQIYVDENQYLLWLSAYIHLNPVIAGLVGDVSQYPWSSFNEYVGQPLICDPSIITEQLTSNGYAEFVRDANEIIQEKLAAELMLD